MASIDWSQFGGAPDGAKQAKQPTPAPAQKKGGIDWSQFGGEGAMQQQVAPQQLLAPAKAPPAAPAEHSGLGDMWAAAKHHAGNFVYGTGQLLANGVATLAHKMEPGSDLDQQTAAMAARANAEMRQREQAYQKNVPDNGWSYAGAAGGMLAPLVFSGPTRAMEAAGDAAGSLAARVGVTNRVANNVIRATTQGAAASTVSPIANVSSNGLDSDYWSKKGSRMMMDAAVGGSMPLGVSLLKGAASAGRALAAPFTDPLGTIAPTLQNMVPRDAHIDEIVRQLRNPESFVPGSKPTTAQLLQTPEAVMTEKAFSNTPAGKIALEARRNSNNDARLAHVDTFAGSDAELIAAIAQRARNAGPMADRLANSSPIDASPILKHIDDLASTGLGTDPVIRSAMGDARRILTDHGSPGENDGLFVNPDILDGVRQNMGGYLKKYASNGAVSSRQEAALVPLKNTISETVDRGVPGYRDYLASYWADSLPINTMEQIQGIRSNLDNAAFTASGAPLFSLGGARQAVRSIDRSRTPISQEAEAGMDNVLSDLQRESISGSVRAAGSDTNLNGQMAPWLTRQMYGDGITGKPAVGAGLGAAVGGGIGAGVTAFAGPTAGAATSAFLTPSLGWAGKKLADNGAQRMNDALAKALLNPDVAADVLEKQATQQANNKAMADLLRRMPVVNGYVDQPTN